MYGMECLFRFYSYGLEKRWNANLYRDFEEMTLKVLGGLAWPGEERKKNLVRFARGLQS